MDAAVTPTWDRGMQRSLCKRRLVFFGIVVAMLADGAAGAPAGDARLQEPSAFSILQRITPDGIEALRRRADTGELRAQYLLALAYEFGRGVAQDSAVAMNWYTRAAERGYCAAQMVLGRKYYFGDDVAQDYAHAYRWLEPLANSGRLLAIEALADREADRAKRRHWYDVMRDLRSSYAGDPRTELLDPEAGCLAPAAAPRSGPAPLRRERFRLKGDDAWVHDLAFSRDGKRLYSVSFGEEIVVWDTVRGARQSPIPVPGDPLAILTHGERVLVRVPGKHVIAGRITQGRFEPQSARGERVRFFCCENIGTGDRISRIEEIRTADGTFYRHSRTGQSLASVPPRPGEARIELGMDVSPDLKWIVYGETSYGDDPGTTIHIWDIAGARALRRLTPHYPLRIDTVAYSPDGRYLVTGGSGNSSSGVATLRNIRLWEIASGREVRGFLSSDGFVNGVTQLVFSPDGTRLAAVGSNFKNEYVYVFDLASGRELARLEMEGYGSGIGRLVFSPDGKQLAVARGADINLYSLEGL
jgi:WD40 repeat protein